MIAVWIALINSLAAAVGGPTGALVAQLVNTIGAVTLDKAELEAFAGPWITWANGIVDADRDPTDEEREAARSLADAVHNNNRSLGGGGPSIPLPSPPTV
jgi:hypothetical protein